MFPNCCFRDQTVSVLISNFALLHPEPNHAPLLVAGKLGDSICINMLQSLVQSLLLKSFGFQFDMFRIVSV